MKKITKLNTQIIQLEQKRNYIQNSHSCTDKIVNEKNKIAAQQSEKLGETSQLASTHRNLKQQ